MSYQSPYYSAVGISIVPIILILPLFIFRNRPIISRTIHYMTYYAIGALTAEIFSHVCPELFEAEEKDLYGMLIGVGIIVFMILDMQLAKYNSKVLIYFIGDLLHNLCDGLLLGATYNQRDALGIVTSLSIAVHEVSHEIADFVVYFQSNVSFLRIVLYELMSGVGMILGVMAADVLHNYNLHIMSFATGALLFTLFGIYQHCKEHNDVRKTRSDTMWRYGMLIVGYVCISSIHD